MNQALRARLYANDRLLKALTTLLAIRDPNLLEELRIVFDLAAQTNNEIGKLGQDAWVHLEEEMALIEELVGRGKPANRD